MVAGGWALAGATPVTAAPAAGGRAPGLARVATAAVLVPAFVWTVLAGPPWLFAALVTVASGLAARELERLFRLGGQPSYGALPVLLAPAVAASFALPAAGGPLPAATLAAAVALLLSAPLWRAPGPAMVPAGLAVLAVVYVGWLPGHAILLHRLADGPALVLVLVGVTWVGETAAYLVGSAIGRRPLAPVLSPRKTLEGGAAQVLASVAAAVALGPLWLLPDWAAGRAALAGLLLGVVGQVGDLAESALKRSAGVKDTGGLLPGHGGLLDRVDGLLFNAPAFYYLVRLGGPA